MRIDSSQVEMTATHAKTRVAERKESLRAWVGARRPDFEGAARRPGMPLVDTTSISEGARKAKEAAAAEDVGEGGPTEPKLKLLVAMIEAVTGEKVRIVDIAEFRARMERVETEGQAFVAERTAAAQGRVGWGVEYDLHEKVVEAETATFSASGVVKTADGKEVRFDLELVMARQAVSEHNVSVRLGDARLKDPLVLNFDGTAAQLSDLKVEFDLDSDGAGEQMSFVKGGNAFLFIDRDMNGRPTNGAELFGPTTGNGFEELAEEDADGDGWIDEDDPVFNFLRLWSKDPEGNDVVETLEERGVGAIAVGHVATPFDLVSGDGALAGRVAATGVYLAESGGAGAVQHLDIAV